MGNKLPTARLRVTWQSRQNLCEAEVSKARIKNKINLQTAAILLCNTFTKVVLYLL